MTNGLLSLTHEILGGHLDNTYRRRNSTLAGRVLGLLASVLVVMALPLGFAGKLRVLRTKFLPGALHAIEGSRISLSLLQRLRSVFVSAAWSKKMPLAHVGAFLSLLDGPPECDPGFFVLWCRFSASSQVSGLLAAGGSSYLRSSWAGC